MSFDIELVDGDGNICCVESHQEGGTYKVGGTSYAKLNVTYNYAWFYYHFLDSENGIRALNGQRAGEWIERLEKAVEVLGDKQYIEYPDGFRLGDKTPPQGIVKYWAPTPGNAGYALSILLGWARQYPDAVFEVR